MASTAAAPRRGDMKIMSLICAGHFVSHFYMLALPALFIFLHNDMGIGYTLLGAMLSMRYISAGSTQLPAGFLVDRYGAKQVLLAGMTLMIVAFALMAFAPNYWVLLLLVIIGGIGDSVFHPADYAILNGSVSESRMGRAFSIHTFAGHLGFAAAPTVITVLSSLWGWRNALLVVAAFGFVILGLVATQWSSLRDDVVKKPRSTMGPKTGLGERMSGHARLLSSRPVLVLFAFFAMSTLGNAGINSFGIPALNALHGTSAVDAGAAVGAFMLVSSLAVLVGGWIADNIAHKDRFAAGIYALSIFAVLLITIFSLEYLVLVVLFGFAGFCHGVIRPARDMMVREITPAGSSGKVFGFVFTGQNVGGAVAPLILGAVMDNLPPEWIFYTSMGFMALCIITILIPRGQMKEPAPALAEDSAAG